MALFPYILQKLGRLFLTVFLISTLVFVVVRVIPGDPALILADVDATPEAVEAIRQRLGTDKPLFDQYANWLTGLARLDLGVSLISERPVARLILERLPITLSLALMGFAVSIVISIPLGVISAVRRWSGWDIFGRLFSQFGMAVPSFVMGLVLLLVFGAWLGWMPLFGSGGVEHLVLPALALGLARAAILVRLTRASMLEEMGKEYVLTARAKGLTEPTVRYRHLLKNALLPVVTIAGMQLGAMLGGAIIIEQVFSLPGVGRLFLSGIYQRDFPLIQGGVIFVAFAFCIINFGVDLLYGVLNPKIRIGRK